MTCGVYSITNTKNKKRYIGSAVNVEKRWRQHRKGLQDGTHQSRHLQAAWQKYGEDVFQFELIASCDRDELLSLEQFWIDAFRSADSEHGYNLSPTAGNTLGVKYSAEARAKLSALSTGRKYSAEARASMGNSRRGRKRSEETRARISVAAKAALAQPEVRAKISAANLGRKRSIETTARMSVATREMMTRPGVREHLSAVQLGRKHTLETRRKVSAGVREAQARPGAREKIAEVRRGKKRTDETKAKMSEIARRNPGPKLNEESVRKIRELLDAGVMRVEIAEMFGVSTTCIGHIKTGKNWSHVK